MTDRLTDERVAMLTDLEWHEDGAAVKDSYDIVSPDDIMALAREVQQARQRIAALEAAMREAEWTGGMDGADCPWCGNGPRGGHELGCIALTLPPGPPKPCRFAWGTARCTLLSGHEGDHIVRLP